MYKIEDKKLFINGQVINFDFPIYKVEPCDTIILVLLDPDANVNDWGQYPNLYAVTPEGKILWRAELPTTNTGDCYDTLEISDGKIKVYSWCSWECFIDPKTGKIIEKIFTK